MLNPSKITIAWSTNSNIMSQPTENLQVFFVRNPMWIREMLIAQLCLTRSSGCESKTQRLGMVLYTVQERHNETLKIPYPLQHHCRGCGCATAGNYLQQIYIRLQGTYYEKVVSKVSHYYSRVKHICHWTKSDHNCYMANSSGQNDRCKISCCLDIM